MDIRKEILGKI